MSEKDGKKFSESVWTSLDFFFTSPFRSFSDLFPIFPAPWHQYPISRGHRQAWMLGVRPGWTALSVDGQAVQTKD